MNQQERDIIQGIFDRLRSAEGQPRDVEAEKFIAELQARQPYAPYVLAQSVYALEHSLNSMSEKLQTVERELADLKAKPAAPAQGGFLSGIFGNSVPAAAPAARPSGPWGQSAPQAQQMQQAAPQGGPWGGQQPAAPARAGGGFLATAATAAVGVAGGMLAANAISSMMSGGQKPAAQAESGSGSSNTASSNQDQMSGSGEDNSYDNDGYDDGGGWGDDGEA